MYGTFLTEPTLQAANYVLSHQRDCPLVFIFYRRRGCINEAFLIDHLLTIVQLFMDGAYIYIYMCVCVCVCLHVLGMIEQI